MSEQENTGEQSNEIIVPVTVTKGQMKDVTKPMAYSRKSVVFINNKGHVHMVPEDMALVQVKKGNGHIIEKKHKDYMRLYKMALGYDEKVKTDKFLQKAGKVMSIEDSSRLDLKALIEKEQAEIAKAAPKPAAPAKPAATAKGAEEKK